MVGPFFQTFHSYIRPDVQQQHPRASSQNVAWSVESKCLATPGKPSLRKATPECQYANAQKGVWGHASRERALPPDWRVIAKSGGRSERLLLAGKRPPCQGRFLTRSNADSHFSRKWTCAIQFDRSRTSPTLCNRSPEGCKRQAGR